MSNRWGHYAPDPQPDEPTNANDRYDFRRWVADPTDDAPGIVRRHVAILTGEQGVPRTKAWKIAMAEIRMTRPMPTPGAIRGGASGDFYYECPCGDNDSNSNIGGLKRTRTAHHKFHVEQRRADRALLDEMSEKESV